VEKTKAESLKQKKINLHRYNVLCNWINQQELTYKYISAV